MLIGWFLVIALYWRLSSDAIIYEPVLNNAKKHDLPLWGQHSSLKPANLGSMEALLTVAQFERYTN